MSNFYIQKYKFFRKFYYKFKLFSIYEMIHFESKVPTLI